MNENNPYYNNQDEKTPKQSLSSIAIASLVLGIISIISCFFLLNFVFGIISIVLSIVAIRKKASGKPLSITGMSLSIISFIISTFILILIHPLLAVLPDLYHDMKLIYSDYDNIIEEFDRTGNLPEYMDKYDEGEIGVFFDEHYDGFDYFFDKNLRLENLT